MNFATALLQGWGGCFLVDNLAAEATARRFACRLIIIPPSLGSII